MTKGNLLNKVLKSFQFNTPLGPMWALADEEKLYLLEFIERKKVGKKVEELCKQVACSTAPGRSGPIETIEKEMSFYFSGKLSEFQTPIKLVGTPFQIRVWQELLKVPYGVTKSYQEEAEALGQPRATRAVANANGTNRLAIIVPCHRIIRKGGALGGYAGGVDRKKSLLDHERKFR